MFRRWAPGVGRLPSSSNPPSLPLPLPSTRSYMLLRVTYAQVMKSIIAFYSKAKAHVQLSDFYDACAQVWC